MTESQNKPAAALEWKSFDSPPPDGTEIVWKDEQDQIGTGYYCAEDAKWWKGFWMTAHELVNFAPKASAVPKIIKLDNSVNCYAFGSEVSMPRPPSPPQAEEALAAQGCKYCGNAIGHELECPAHPANRSGCWSLPAVPTSRVHQSIDTCPMCKGRNSGIGTDGVENDCIECFRREVRSQASGFNPDWDQTQAAQDSVREHMGIAMEAIARAEKAETQLAAIRAGLEGLQRYDEWHTQVGTCVASSDDGDYVKHEDVLALFQPQQKSDTPR